MLLTPYDLLAFFNLKKIFIPRYVIEDFAISFDDLERRSCNLNTSLYH